MGVSLIKYQFTREKTISTYKINCYYQIVGIAKDSYIQDDFKDVCGR